MISAQASRRAVWRPLWELPRRWDLILSLARRELAAKYKGSAGGILWAVLTPLVMIAIFTFVFAKIFGARFGTRFLHFLRRFRFQLDWRRRRHIFGLAV